MGLRRGDIVWARVIYPKKWWPGLVLNIDGLGVAVSFFDDGENPRYFLEKEVCSFQENFDSLVNTLEKCCKGKELLDSALKLLSRRVASSLKCSCLFRQPPLGDTISRWTKRKRGDLFRSDAVLDFALGAAVSPFVGVSDLAFAVTAIAQLNVFRCYLVSEQKLFLHQEKTRQRHERNECICSSPWLGSGACSVAQKSNASELEFELLKEDQPNSGSWIQSEQTQSQSAHKMLVNLHNLALDTNYTRGECLNSVKQNFCMFRNCARQTTLNLGFRKCSPRSNEAQFSYPWSYSRPRAKVNEKDYRDVSASLKPNVASPLNLLGLKRRHDYPVDSGFSFKLRKTMPHFLINVDAYFQKGKHGLNVCMLDALISVPALPDISLKFCNIMPFSFFNGAHLQKNRSKCEANTSDAFLSESQLGVFMIEDASSRTRNNLPSPRITNKIQMLPSSDDDETSVETNKNLSINTAFRDSSMDDKKLHLLVTSDVSFKLQVAQQSTLGTISNCQSLHMKFPRDFHLPSKNDLIAEFSRFGKVDSSRTKTFTRMGSAQVVFFHQIDALAAYQHAKKKKGLFGEANILFWLDAYENKRRGSKFVVPSPNLKSSSRTKNYQPSPYTTNQIHMQPSNDDEETSVETTKMFRINSAIRDCFMDNKKLRPFVTSDVSFKPQVAQESRLGAISNCQYLHMKFPRDFNLPSKKDLIRKFSRFGKVDSFRTKIFTHMDSAQVVFLHHLDAVAAYQYAKRKKGLFGGANIMFWLDPYEKERRESKFVDPLPNPKSCLKNSDLRGQRDKKRMKRVKFFMEVPLPNLKSCLKDSDLHGQEDNSLPNLKSCLKKSNLLRQEDKKCTKRPPPNCEVGSEK